MNIFLNEETLLRVKIKEAFDKEFPDEKFAFQDVERAMMIFKAGFLSGASHITQELGKEIGDLDNVN